MIRPYLVEGPHSRLPQYRWVEEERIEDGGGAGGEPEDEGKEELGHGHAGGEDGLCFLNKGFEERACKKACCMDIKTIDG